MNLLPALAFRRQPVLEAFLGEQRRFRPDCRPSVLQPAPSPHGSVIGDFVSELNVFALLLVTLSNSRAINDFIPGFTVRWHRVRPSIPSDVVVFGE